MPPKAEHTDTDGVFRALAHPIRRRLLDLLRQRPRTTGELAEQFEISRFGVMKHLAVLEEAHLLLVTRRGRERWNHLNPVPVAEIHRRYVSRIAESASERLLGLRTSLEGETTMTESVKTEFAVAEVVSEVKVAAPPKRVWEAITGGIGDWWPAGFYSSERPSRMVLEARLGGRVYEDWGTGDASGLLWYTVIGIEPGRELRLSGELSPDWGGPARLSTRWTLTPEGDGTVVRLQEVLSGRIAPETQANMTRGWDTILGHLRPFAEAAAPKPRTAPKA
jgi:DNA-binding transcriptional ArsR family regulator/uncharacterized protein YndB with AHSA1/START domain